MLLISITCACANRRQLTPEDAKSQLTEAISIAASAELSIERAQSGATNHAFETGNAKYLRQQIDDQLKELQDKQPNAAAEAAVQQCRDGLSVLRKELDGANTEPDRARQRIHAIGDSLQRAKASL